MTGEIDAETVRRIADLARLDLDADELSAMVSQFKRIVEYVDRIGGLDTGRVQPLHHVHDLRGVLREDVPQPSLPVEEALRNAPARKGDYFLMPGGRGGS